ncbi:MFS transporter [Nonomuraea sp. bgisy101]|uniref:MFS transporter n=1 Tax=Nonomuraea sp. bgisy101 TaxID=3413784 RepID=UPI003D72E9C0
MTAGVTPAARRVIRTLNGFKLFTGLLWWLPIYYVYQRDHGLSDGEIFGIQSIYYLAFCLLEIPTGALADRFDYRRFLRAGAVVLTAANLVPVAWTSYGGFLTHFLLVALGNSLVSGAGSAYLFEYLQRTGSVAAYQQAEGSGRAYTLTGRIAGLPAAGVLMQWYAPSPYWLSAACCAVAVLLAIRLPALPPGGEGHGGRHTSVRDQLLVGRVLRHSPLLMLLIAQGVAVFTLVRIGQANLFQPILTVKELPLAAFGVIMAVTTVFELAGAARSTWLRRFGDVPVVFALTTVMAATLALVAVTGATGTVILLCVFSLASGLVFPVQRRLVNTAITDSRHRATLLSLESLIDRSVCAVVVLALSGYLSEGAMDLFLTHVAVGTVVLMAALAVLLRRSQQRRHATAQAPTATKENVT